jgi:hypothetical protein
VSQPRLWPVFAAYLLAFVAIVGFSVVVAVMLRAALPGLSEREVFDGLPGLLAGGVASSTALLVTVLVVARPIEPVRLRLVPGRETGDQLAAMILGTLALGQVLDSATMLAGFGNRGAMAVAVVLTSVAFGLLHLEWIHAALAVGLGLWLGFITARAGSALPAIAAHVINNVVFTVLTATLGTTHDRALNMGLLTTSTVIFGGCLFWISRMPVAAPEPKV